MNQHLRDTWIEYKTFMAKDLSRTLSMIKSAIEWDSHAIIEIIDYTVQEFPHWKPEDFMLMCRKIRHGEYRTKYEMSLDYPTLMSWLHRYDHDRINEIENERVIDVPTAPELPEKNYTQEEVDRYTRDFYQMMKEKQEARRPVEPVTEPEFMYLKRKGFQAYREAAEDCAKEESNRFMKEAARQQFMAENPAEEWVEKWIRENVGG